VNDDDRQVLRETLIREAAGLAVMAVVLWYFGPGKLIMSGWRHRAKTWAASRGGPIDVQVAQFRAEVSRWDHEQAAQQDRRAGGAGPCGCR
jgi:hypothetical protein